MNPPSPVARVTGVSKVATRRRCTPKTLKKPSQNDLASASSLDSSAHSLANSKARRLISFSDNGMRAPRPYPSRG